MITFHQKPKEIGTKQDYTCGDGVTRSFNSLQEIEFLKFLERQPSIKIIGYGNDEFEIIPDTFGTPQKPNNLHQVFGFFKVTQMRKPERAIYTPDFIILIDGVKWVVELKSTYTENISQQEKESLTAYQLRKRMFMSQYKYNFLEVIANDGDFILNYWYIGESQEGKEKYHTESVIPSIS